MKRLCEEYAAALYELAEENSLEDIISNQLTQIACLLAYNPDYIKLLDNPAVEKQTRVKLAEESFSGAEQYLKNFIMLLVEARRVNELEECAKVFSRIYDEKHNIVRAEAVTAAPLDKAQSARIKEKLEVGTGKTVILTNTIDPSIIGGVLLKYGTEQIDMSVRTSLNSISDLISNADI